jgi:polysaccharide biosynthesis protein PslE
METQETSQTSLRNFLYVLFKRRTLILLFFFATVCTVAIGTFVIDPVYEAYSQVLVKVGRENLYVPPTGNVSPVISLNREEQINSEIEIVRSRSLLEQVVQAIGPTMVYQELEEERTGILGRILGGETTEPSPADSAVLLLEKALQVDAIKKSNVIEITFQHKDPLMAAAVVNKLVSLYLDRHLDVHKTPHSYAFFKEQSQILETKLKEVEAQLEVFKKQHNVTSLAEERSLLLRQESDLRVSLNQTLSSQAETENRISQLQKHLASVPENIPQGEEIDHNPYIISTLQARLVELELKEKDLLTKYTEESRLVRNVREEIQIVREKLGEQETKRYGKTRSGLNVTHQRLQEEFLRNQAEGKALAAKKETQESQLADYKRKLEMLNQIEVELNQLQQQVDVHRQNYRLYLTKFEESRISDAMDTEKITNVTQIQPAQVPLKPVKPRVLLNLVLGFFLAAFGGLGLAFFVEYLDEGLEKPEDVEEALDLPVLASIPELKE